jgi:hypothetical protein
MSVHASSHRELGFEFVNESLTSLARLGISVAAFDHLVGSQDTAASPPLWRIKGDASCCAPLDPATSFFRVLKRAARKLVNSLGQERLPKNFSASYLIYPCKAHTFGCNIFANATGRVPWEEIPPNGLDPKTGASRRASDLPIGGSCFVHEPIPVSARLPRRH